VSAMRTLLQILKLLVGAALIIGNFHVLQFAMLRVDNNYSRALQTDYEIMLLVSALSMLYVAATFWRLNPKSRIGTLVSLWFDAKEQELRQRGTSPPEPND
jgi:hypothetical protein